MARWTLGFAATVALVGLLLTVPRSRNDVSLATEVGQALGQVQTWHLKGWKLQNGKPVAWEVWGRRQPGLFWERVGNDITFDDGKTRIREFAPQTGKRPVAGVFLNVASVGNIAELGGGSNYQGISYRNMINAHDWFRIGKPVQQDQRQARFHLPANTWIQGVKEDDYYTVNARTALPVLYEHKVTENGRLTVNEHLTAEYNAALPPAVRHLTPPPGYRNLDVSHTPAEAHLPTENTVSANGLTVQATPLGMDAQGNVLVRLRGWLGNIRLLSPNRPGTDLVMEVNMANAAPDGKPLYRDDRDRPYFYVQSVEKSMANGDIFCLLAPHRPLSVGSPRPHALTITLSFWPAFGVPVIDHVTDTSEDTRLFQQDLQMTLPLSNLMDVTDLTPLYPETERAFQAEQPLEAIIATQRSGQLYMASVEAPTPEIRHELLVETVSSYKQALHLIGPQSSAYWPDQFVLAQYYSRLGSWEGPDKFTADHRGGRRHTNWKGDTRRAEKYLTRVDKPDSWD